MSSVDPNPQSVALDYVRLRTDRNLAWEDDFDPLRPLWWDETGNPNFNAVIAQGPAGTAEITQQYDGTNTWGQVQSEMLVMDLYRYPWLSTWVADVPFAANYIGGVQYQTDPYRMKILVQGADAPFMASGEIGKAGTNTLDLLRAACFVEGSNKTVTLDRVRIGKRAPDVHAPYWDYPPFSVVVGADQPVVVPFTATDYEGGQVYYRALHLPINATYDGFVSWQPAWPQMGTYRPILIASNQYGEIRKRVSITVTNEIYQLVAPMWSMTHTNVTTNLVTLAGTFEPTSSNEVISVSVGTSDSFTTEGVSQTNYMFWWTGVVTGSPVSVFARVSNTVTGAKSSADQCDVYYVPRGPRLLGQPVFQVENPTQVWVLTRADQPVAATVNYGTDPDYVDEFTVTDTNKWMTHATLVTVDAERDYWFQVYVTNDTGDAAVSETLHYPASGRKWGEGFDAELAGWRDATTDPEFLVSIVATEGVGRVTIPAAAPGEGIYGKVLSSKMTVDLNLYPILEMYISRADYANVGYQIGLQEEVSPWRYVSLLDESRSGTVVLNIPKLTGWSGESTFTVAFNMSSAAQEEKSIDIDYMTIRTEQNVAWEEHAGPLRGTWIDEGDEPGLHAYIEDNGDGTATLRQQGGSEPYWGQVRGEMIMLDLEEYPWVSVSGTNIAYNATLKVQYLDQRGSNGIYPQVPYISRYSAQSNVFYEAEAATAKFYTNAVDLFRQVLIIEGTEARASIDQLQVTKRSALQDHLLYWDFLSHCWHLQADIPAARPFTATDFDGAETWYEGTNLPDGATYDGVFRWNPVSGIYTGVTFIARSDYAAITNVLTIVVTGLPYTVHLSYDDETGVDSFPQALAEQSNFTGAAATWMVCKYMKDGAFTNAQQVIYDATTHDPAHGNEITAASCATYLRDVGWPPYNFAARSAATLAAALAEAVYWMDYLPPDGDHAPSTLLTGTNWSYKVARGFQTDVKPYDGGFAPGGQFTIHGLWLNDPRVEGLGHVLYVPADSAAEVYPPSEADGTYRLVVEPPLGAAYDDAAALLATKQVTLCASSPDPDWADYLASLTDSGEPAGRTEQFESMPPDLLDVVPGALLDDKGFMDLFDAAGGQETYVVNRDVPESRYVLLAGGLSGPGSTVFVLKLATNGTMSQATWDPAPARYPLINSNAAVWKARQTLGNMSAGVVDAGLVYTRDRCRSPFHPDWEVKLYSAGTTQTVTVAQGTDLSGDSDFDGMSDGDELYVGTDPLDDESVFTVSAEDAAQGGQGLIITWSSLPGVTYRIDRATNIMTGLSLYTSGIPATPPMNTYTDQVPDEQVFYRIGAE
ncbi:MAG: hypothetical protein JXB04_03335 [Kiritimatiellae bacterium]|nr:hypothetical protein [Kiritimatiellia bacterium]